MSDELKTRLVGAITLLAILALLWPFVFDDADEIRLSRDAQIPEPPAVEEWEVEPQPKPDPESIGWPAGDSVGGEPADNSADPEQGGEQLAVPEPVFRKAWSVQVASLSNADNAAKLVEKLLKDGYRAYSRIETSATGSIVRVFVGPKFDRRQAASIKLKVDSQYSVNSLIVRYVPTET